MPTLKAVALSLFMAMIFGIIGCNETTGVQEQTKITSPTGTTTVTKDTKVESQGSNPPAVNSETAKKLP